MEEKNLEAAYEKSVLPRLLEKYTTDYFSSIDGGRIRYIVPRVTGQDTGIVIVGGRTEYIEKYGEVICDLEQESRALYCFDHRGQGGSGRIIADRRKGHVHNFSDYVDDLQHFIEEIVVPRHHDRIVLIAFSMGCAVGSLYLQRERNSCCGAIFCSPMFGIYTSYLSDSAAKWLTEKAVSCGLAEQFVIGGSRRSSFHKLFPGNPLTSSRVRFSMHKHYLMNNPELIIGSPTWGWVREALNAGEEAIQGAPLLDVPVLLLQSGRDRIIDNTSHALFCRRAPLCNVIQVKRARHELLMERDLFRDRALHEIELFLDDLNC